MLYHVAILFSAECSLEVAKNEVDTSIQRLFYYGAYADKYGGSVQETTLYGCTVRIHEPVGVVGIACPDECPLLGFVSLFAPAVIRGNTIIIMPSQKYPLSATDLYQVKKGTTPPFLVNCHFCLSYSIV